jgi:hypothetical protein
VTEVSGSERKEIAVRIVENPCRGIVFAALEGPSILLQAWSASRPRFELPFGVRAKEVA